MSIKRIAAIGAIFAAACAGWVALGATTSVRSFGSSGRLGEDVEALWGAPVVQQTPSFSVEIPGSDRSRSIMPEKNDVRVELNTDYRKRGLIWYPTYTCAFDGTYAVSNDEPVAQKIHVHFALPAPNGTYDEFAASIDGAPILSAVNPAEGVNELIELAPGKSAEFRVAYKTRGIREWRYAMDPRVGRVRNLDLAVHTGFRAVDYPDGCLSPMESGEAPEGGMALVWRAADLITQQDIGVVIPEKLNPGPLTSRITFFAPVCLAFFFGLVFAIDILYKVGIHPMHYLFVAGGFFAFHLLLSYLAGLVDIHLDFAIAAAVSVGLVTSYLSGALRGRFPWKIAAAGQIFYLILFSYSFFLEGLTGLTVAVGAVVTLAVLMKTTSSVDWNAVFTKTADAPDETVPDSKPVAGNAL